MTRIACISDTHGKHDEVIVPDNIDVLLHAGDFTSSGTIAQTKAFLEWFSKQPAKHKIFISGNHDFLDQDQSSLFNDLVAEYPGLVYLRDEGTEIDGLRIWGRPWTPRFFDWAFMSDPGSNHMRSTLQVIPEGIDILLTHGPAKGILDMTIRGERVGCEDMLEALDRIQPKYVVCGHIHESAGVLVKDGVTHVNAATLSERYIHKNQPIIIEIP